MLQKIIIFNQNKEFLAEVVFNHDIFQQFILNQKGNKYLEYWFEEWRLHGVSDFKFYFNLVTKEKKGWSVIDNFKLHSPLFAEFFKQWLLENGFLFFSLSEEASGLWYSIEQIQGIDFELLLDLGSNLKYLTSKKIDSWKKKIEAELIKNELDQVKMSKLLDKMAKDIL